MNSIELANDSGLTYYGMGKDRARFIYHLEAFAALVAAAARADEREACAKECERMMMYPNAKQESAAHQNVWAAAKAIRERGTT